MNGDSSSFKLPSFVGAFNSLFLMLWKHMNYPGQFTRKKLDPEIGVAVRNRLERAREVLHALFDKHRAGKLVWRGGRKRAAPVVAEAVSAAEEPSVEVPPAEMPAEAPAPDVDAPKVDRPERRLPRKEGWLVALIPMEAAIYRGQLEMALRDPEMMAVMLASPEASRVLRPICRMLGCDMTLLLRPEGAWERARKIRERKPRKPRKRSYTDYEYKPRGRWAGPHEVQRITKRGVRYVAVKD